MEKRSSLYQYAKSIRRYNRLPLEDQLRLGKIKDEGDTPEKRRDAYEALVHSELQTVVKIAKIKSKMCPGHLNDLIQTGNEGLMKGVEKYDYSKGLRLMTYCAWWINAKMNDYQTNKTRTVRIPKYIITNSRKNSIEIPSISIEGLLDFGLEIEEGKISNPQEIIEKEEIIEKAREALEMLDPRQKDVIIRRYGLNGNEKETLRAIGEDYGITTERIRQIQSKAIEKMREILGVEDLRN